MLGLSRVLMLPAATPPHKAADRLSPAEQREAMLKLAIREYEGLAISRIELLERRVCYTIDTLRRMRASEPPCDPVFLLGQDSLLQITTWRAWREDEGQAGQPHPEVCARIVSVAEGVRPPQIGRGGRIFRLPVPPIVVSSSTIRQRARRGEDLSGLVPPAVARYIHDMGLYRQGEPR
jgi:nicotinate-nucleotide adenylyltransferase